MRRDIAVVGSINLDLVCNASRIPAPGETIWGDKFQTFNGGKGANQAVAAGRLGAGVFMVGKVGDDAFGASLRQGLLDSHVNVDEVGSASGVASGVAMILVDANGQNTITVVPGANGKLTPRDLERSLPRLRSAGVILAQLEIPMETVEFLGHVSHRAGVPFILDPAPARTVPEELLRCVTYLTPNESETCTLCGMEADQLTEESAPAVAQSLLDRGVANIILKMGGAGVFLASQDGTRRFIPAFKVNAVDTTAAGDAFNGGFAAALMRGLSFEEAARYGVAVAAISVTRHGAQPAMPVAAEVDELLHGDDKRYETAEGIAVQRA